jgi:hypothetical protein
VLYIFIVKKLSSESYIHMCDIHSSVLYSYFIFIVGFRLRIKIARNICVQIHYFPSVKYYLLISNGLEIFWWIQVNLITRLFKDIFLTNSRNLITINKYNDTRFLQRNTFYFDDKEHKEIGTCMHSWILPWIFVLNCWTRLRGRRGILLFCNFQFNLI